MRTVIRHLRCLTLTVTACAAIAVGALCASVTIAALTPVHAQVSAEFQSALEPYGSWQPHPRFGEVWVPYDLPPGWRPYTYGRWVYTEEWGWYWVSDEEEADWGWVAFHYGRWAHDRRLGWFWVPGDEWGPAWVDWRRGDDYVGWAPLPPDEAIYEYGNDPAYWIFLPPRYLVAPRVRTYFLPPQRTVVVFRRTVIVNRTVPEYLPGELVDDVAKGRIDSESVRAAFDRVGLKVSEPDFAGLLTETIEHASTLKAQQDSAAQLDDVKVARMTLPALADGVDLGGLYELAEILGEQGVR